MKYTFSKKIIRKLIENELNKTEIKIAVLTPNNIENIYRIIKNGIKEKKQDSSQTITKILKMIIEKIIDEKNDFGCFDSETHELKVRLSNIKKISKNKEEFLLYLIMVAYHEYQHALLYEDIIKKDSSIRFKVELDQVLAEISNYYNSAHDDFYLEIMANNYSIEKTIKMLKKHPNIYQKLDLNIEYNKLLYQIYSKNYDIQRILNYITIIIKNNKKEIIKYFENYDILKYLFTENGDLKFEETNSLEEQYLIASSKAYLNDIDYKNQSKEKLEFILKALNYTYNMEKNRYRKNNKLKDLIKEFNKKVDDKNPDFIYNQSLLPLLKRKQQNTKHKLIYLQLQITKINLILNEKTNNKKLIRKQNA